VVKRRQPVEATIELSNRDGGNDWVRVGTSPAVKTTVTIFRVVRRGDPVEVGRTQSGDRGVARLTIADDK